MIYEIGWTKGIPHTKVSMEMQTIKICGLKVKTKVPVPFERSVEHHVKVSIAIDAVSKNLKRAVERHIQYAMGLTVAECAVEMFFTSPKVAWGLFKEKFAGFFTVAATADLGIVVVKTILATLDFKIEDKIGNWNRVW
jgi:hypothetical protein